MFNITPPLATQLSTVTPMPILLDELLTKERGVITTHPFAGRCIDIQHRGQYKTRYLYLQKLLFHQGESVSRGQPITLSG